MAPTAQEMEDLLRALLSHDNTVRKSAETSYEHLKDEPRWLLPCLLHIVKGSKDPGVQHLAGVMLRRGLAGTSQTMFYKLDKPEQEAMKEELLSFLSQYSEDVTPSLSPGSCSKGVHNSIAYCTAGLGAWQVEGGQWPALLPFLMQQIQSGHPAKQQSGLSILSQLISTLSDEFLITHFQSLVAPLAFSLAQNQPLKVHTAALEAMSELANAIEDPKYKKKLQAYVPALIGTLRNALDAGDAQSSIQSLECLISMAEDSILCFKPTLVEVWTQVINIAQAPSIPESVTQMAVEFMVTLVENSKAFRTKKDLLEALLHVAIRMMMAIDHDDEWGLTYDEDSPEDASSFDVGYEACDRMALALGGKVLVPISSPLLLAYFQKEEWQSQWAALMAFSQMMEGCSQLMIQQLPQLMIMGVAKTTHPHPRVRFAAIQCLAQLSTTFKPEFQSKSHGRVVPALLTCFSDPVPRVAAHAALTLVNFFEDAELDQVGIYVDGCMEALLNLVQNTTVPFVHSNALAAIAAIAQLAQTGFSKHYPRVMAYLKEVISNTSLQPQHRIMRGRAMLCIAYVGMAVGAEAFRPDAKGVLEFLLQTKLAEADPQTTSLHQAVGMMADVMGEDFIPYIPNVVNPLLQLLAVEDGPSPQDVDPDSISDFDTAKVSEKASSLATLIRILGTFQSHMGPHIQQLARLTLPLIRHSYYAPIREHSATLLPLLMLTYTEGHFQGQYSEAQWMELRGTVHQTLLKAISNEHVPNVQQVQIGALHQLVQLGGDEALANLGDIDWMMVCATTLNSVLQASVKRWGKIYDEDDNNDEDQENKATFKAGGEDSDSEIEDSERKAEDEEDLQETILDCMEGLLLTHHCFTQAFSEVLMQPFCQLLHAESDVEKALGLCGIAHFVSIGGTKDLVQLQPYASVLVPAYFYFLQSDNPDIVGPTATGMGALLEHMPELFDNMLKARVGNQLSTILKRPVADDLDLDWQPAICECVLAVFHLVRAYPATGSSVLPVAFTALPVGGEPERCQKVYDLLIQMYEAEVPEVRQWKHLAELWKTILQTPLSLSDDAREKVMGMPGL